MNTQTQDNAYNQAAAQMESISALVAALECDYDRLEELQDQAEDPDTPLTEDEQQELADLTEQANGCTDRDDAFDRIQEDPLSVEVRSGWTTVDQTLEPEEFRILLCTGGPAVQIRGELDEYKTPRRAWLEYQDWGTPWVEYFGEADTLSARATLLTYCQQFYFGE